MYLLFYDGFFRGSLFSTVNKLRDRDCGGLFPFRLPLNSSTCGCDENASFSGILSFILRGSVVRALPAAVSPIPVPDIKYFR
jgi:hypothetical protein